MEIRHYNIKRAGNPTRVGWHSCWHGLSRLEECIAPKTAELHRTLKEEARRLGCLNEGEFEVDILLSLITGIKTLGMTMIELGAGYGRWSIAATGVVRNNLVPTEVKSIKCYAVEAEPTHAKWTRQHFNELKLEGKVFECAISDKDGICQFALENDPSYYYGQSIVHSGGIIRTINKLIRKKRIHIREQTLDTLINDMELLDTIVVDIDVQGAEVKVLKGAENTIKNKLVDYWIIGTHNRRYHQQLQNLLMPHYRLEIDMKPNTIAKHNGMQIKVGDGIQIYSKKNNAIEVFRRGDTAIYTYETGD